MVTIEHNGFTLYSYPNGTGQELEIKKLVENRNFAIFFQVSIRGLGQTPKYYDPTKPVSHSVCVPTFSLEEIVQKQRHGITRSDIVQFALSINPQGNQEEYEVSYENDGVLVSSSKGIIPVNGQGKYSNNQGVESIVYAVTDQNDNRAFSVTRGSLGTNKIIIPQDLHPFIGYISAQGKYIPPEIDLTEAVEFSTY